MQQRILIVDDEPHVTQALRRILRKEPYAVITAQSGSEALRILAEQEIAVIVSDEKMPAMAGSELLSVVRREYPDTMRIVLTGQADLEAAIRSINQGEIFRFLTKPCSEDELIAVISEALQRRDRMLTAREQRRAEDENAESVRDLERLHPGISKVKRSSVGAIVLDDSDS